MRLLTLVFACFAFCAAQTGERRKAPPVIGRTPSTDEPTRETVRPTDLPPLPVEKGPPKPVDPAEQDKPPEPDYTAESAGPEDKLPPLEDVINSTTSKSLWWPFDWWLISAINHLTYTIKNCKACQKKPKPTSCKDLLEQGYTESGIYTIYYSRTPYRATAIDVYCDMTTDGGGWMVIQRRKNCCLDFYKTWSYYAWGFGDLSSEFWFGNEHVHWITNCRQHELRVDMKDMSATHRYAKYRNFKLDSYAEKYKLTVEWYSGNAGDSLSYHNQMKFSTKDPSQDNDNNVAEHCAQLFQGGWWYVSCQSSSFVEDHSNLNGRCLPGDYGPTPPAHGNFWSSFHGVFYSLPFTEMKIRPV